MQMIILARTTSDQSNTLPVQADKNQWIFLSADNLAGAEVCDIFFKSGEAWLVVTDRATSTAVQLTATNPAVRLAGGPLYGVQKTPTAGACGIYADYASREY